MRRVILGMTMGVLGMCISFAWGAFTIRNQIFPYGLIHQAVAQGWVPGVQSRRAALEDAGMTFSGVRASTFAMAPRQVDIVMAGDSRIAYLEWQDFLPDWRVANRGIGGDTVAGLLARTEGLTSVRPQLVYLMIGVNDLAQGRPRESVLADYKTLLDRLAAAGMTPVVQSTLPCRGDACPVDDLRWLNMRLAALAEADGYGFLNILDGFEDDAGYLRTDLTYDGVHLNPMGYEIWVRRLREDVAQRLAR